MGATVVIGLGNPGRGYAATRHNVGFRCVDYFAKKHSARFSRTGCRSKLAEVMLRGKQVLLAKPRTYMNLSGEAAVCFVRAYRVPAEDLILVYDDVDLPLGKVRVRPSGGPGGHNGMKSIVASLNTEGFPRIRVGIGRPDSEGNSPWSEEALIRYVLGRFTADEEAVIQESISLVSDVLECVILEGLDAAMNRYN
ncbi:MAG: aminoacyl-tRNA hydrolase [Chloroflexi bacterium]|nr:aminoacyl-tRNA hydrolase [Chloroflexota bacterium]